MRGETPFFSVIMPVLDGGVVFERCLAALKQSTFDDFELIVVDDGSSDGSGELARQSGAKVLETAGRQGPGRARNLGAHEASGKFLLFVDADCEVHPGTLALAAAELEADPGLDALFGSYDDQPAAATLVSTYKNLQHHYVHHSGRREASTFWAGCGAVRRLVFLDLGGFDTERYARPSIEDIELGMRLRRAGHRIALVPEVQVKHHKRWRLGQLIRTDVFDRGIPWTELMLSQQQLSGDLNLGAGGRASGVLAWLMVLALAGSVAEEALLWVAGLSAVLLLWLNRDFYNFLRGRRGFLFALRAVPLHWLYYLYSVVAFGLGFLRHLMKGRPRG
jgi:glycosyltransferase involved in cell wall biosynthesis